jgi:hypothetical protein
MSAQAADPEPVRRRPRGLGITAATIGGILARCEGEPINDVLRGRQRMMCSAKTAPAFALEAVGDDDQIDRVSLFVPMGGDMMQIAGQMQLGMDFFGAIAGRRIGEFAPKGWLPSISKKSTRIVYGRRVYATRLIPGAGISYSVEAE